ncbi:MAG: hypothetical protein E6I91_16170, partial [Chloroflexi bacterium]
PGCAGGCSPGSPATAAPSPGASRAGRLTRSLSRRSCCRGQLLQESRGPTPDSPNASHRGLPSRKPHWSASRARSGRWGSGGRRRWPSGTSHSRSRSGGGAVPCTRAELERLRGIGPYTASAVLAIVYGRAEPLLDVNMARLLGRFLASSEPVEESPKRTLHALALRLVRGKRSLEVNWAALVCRARRPLCPQCPLRTRCQYLAQAQLQFTPTANALSGSRSAGGR